MERYPCQLMLRFFRSPPGGHSETFVQLASRSPTEAAGAPPQKKVTAVSLLMPYAI